MFIFMPRLSNAHSESGCDSGTWPGVRVPQRGRQSSPVSGGHLTVRLAELWLWLTAPGSVPRTRLALGRHSPSGGY